jgi:hypothetical protein
MIIPHGKKGLSCSLGQLKLLPGDMIVPREKPNFPKEEMYVLNFLAIIVIIFSFT